MASKSKRRRRVLGASCILAALIVAGSSFAWFTSKDEVTNRLSASSDYGVSIVESFTPPKNWLPGQTVNKDVYAVNTGNIDAYVKENIQGVLNYTYEDLVSAFDTSANKYVELTLDQVKAIEGHTEEDGFKTNEAGGYLAWTNAKTTTTTTTPASYKVDTDDATVTKLDSTFSADDSVSGTTPITFEYKVDVGGNTYYAANDATDSKLYNITFSAVNTYTEVPGKTLTKTDASTSSVTTPIETGSINEGRTSDLAPKTPWTPTETGVYVFRRAIHGNDPANPFTYSGYYFDKTTGKYYKVVLGSDNYPAATTDTSATPVKFVYDIYADSKDVVSSVANDIDPDTGEIKTDVGYMFVVEKDVNNQKVTLTYDQNGTKPRLVAEYTAASGTSGTFDASAAAARAQVEYLNELGKYDAAKASYDNAVANHAYGKALAEAEQALYDAKKELESKWSAVNTPSTGAKDEWTTAKTNALNAATYTDDASVAKPTTPTFTDNGIRARATDDGSALDDLQDGILALKPVSDAAASYKVGSETATVVADTSKADIPDSAGTGSNKNFSYKVTVGVSDYYAETNTNGATLYTVDDSGSEDKYTATSYTLSRTESGIMPSEVMQAIAGAPSGNPYVSAMADTNSDFYKAFNNYKTIYEEIYGTDGNTNTGLYHDVQQALNDVKTNSASSLTTTGKAADAKTASATLKSKAEQLKNKMAALQKAYTDFINAADLVSGTNTTTGSTTAAANLATMKTVADNFYTNAANVDSLVDTYVAKEKAYDDAQQALDKATEDWHKAIDKYNTDVAAAKAAYNGDTNSAKTQINDANAWDTNDSKHEFEDGSTTIVPAYSAISTVGGDNPVIQGTAATDSDYKEVYNYAGDGTWADGTALSGTNVTLKKIDADNDKDVDEHLDANNFKTTNKIGNAASTSTMTEAQWKNAIEGTNGYQAKAAEKKKAYDDAVHAKSSGSTLKFYVNLASDWNTYWTMDPGTNETTGVDFYLNKVLEAGETSHKLIDSVEFDKDVSAGAYKDLTFDLNVGLDSVQVTYDENQRGYTTEAVNADPNFAGMKAAITDADANGNNVTWTDVAGTP